MTNIQAQINQAVSYLQDQQANYKQTGSLSVTMDVNDDSIMLYFDADKQTGFTVALDAEFYGNEVITLSINEIEIDSENGLQVVSGEGQDELLLECKKLVHDAVYFNLADDITTDFYHEVYA